MGSGTRKLIGIILICLGLGTLFSTIISSTVFLVLLGIASIALGLYLFLCGC